MIFHVQWLKLHQWDGFGQNSVVAQRTVRLANVRNGLRRITLRNERDIRPYHMAQVLVDIKVFTMDDIQQEDAKLNHVIEVRFFLYVTSVWKFLQTATYEAKCPNDPNEQQRIKMELTRAYNMVRPNKWPCIIVIKHPFLFCRRWNSRSGRGSFTQHSLHTSPK